MTLKLSYPKYIYTFVEQGITIWQPPFYLAEWNYDLLDIKYDIEVMHISVMWGLMCHLAFWAL